MTEQVRLLRDINVTLLISLQVSYCPEEPGLALVVPLLKFIALFTFSTVAIRINICKLLKHMLFHFHSPRLELCTPQFLTTPMYMHYLCVAYSAPAYT